MARTDGKRERHHYVPQMLLRHFALNPGTDRGSRQVYVLDKSNSRVFPSNVQNVAAAYEFYEVETAAKTINAEHLLSELEGKASLALDKIIADRSLAGLERGDREWLSIFTAVQFMRTQTVRGRFAEINAEIEAHIRKMGWDPDNVEGFQRLSPDDIKTLTIRQLAIAVNEYPGYLLAKQWFLLETGADKPFLIGDHPVTLHNDRKMGAYGNLGIAVPGIQIYMPLCPTLTLAMWCPTILNEIEANWREARQTLATIRERQQAGLVLDKAALDDIAKVEASMALSDSIVAAVSSGGAMESTPDNTDMLNALQVKFASRFVMSNKEDFAIAERMFADNDAYRSRRMEGVKVG